MAVALASVVICGGFTPQKAQAIVITKDIYNFGAQVGSISFPSFSGTGTAGVTFDISTPFGPFNQTDITDLSWSINPTTDALTAINLDALVGDAVCPSGPATCSNRTLQLTLDAETPASHSCTAENADGIRLCSTAEEFIPHPFQSSLPEPSAALVFVSGLLGLVLMRRHGERG